MAEASAAKKEEIDKKGKREATVDRVREQEREPDRREILSDYYEEEASGEDDYADDVDDEDLGVRSHHYPPAAFEGRLREFTGYYDVMPPSAPQNGRMKEILSRLRDNGDDFSQTEALTELCNVLSMATENSLAGFSLESFVPVLVGLLNREPFPDVMLLAARALTHLCDALPSSCSAVVHHGAIPAFCARLLTIEYMDLAEQQQPPRPYPTTPNGYSSMPPPGPPGTQPQQQPQMMNPSEGFVSHRRRYSAGAAKEVEPTHRCRGFPAPQRLSQPAARLAVGVQQSPDEYVNELEGAVRER